MRNLGSCSFLATKSAAAVASVGSTQARESMLPPGDASVLLFSKATVRHSRRNPPS